MGVRCRRNVNPHVQQNTYPAKQQQPMYDNVNHQDAYAPGMQGNRNMMNHVDVQQQNHGYNYDQHNAQINAEWMRNQQNLY